MTRCSIIVARAFPDIRVLDENMCEEHGDLVVVIVVGAVVHDKLAVHEVEAIRPGFVVLADHLFRWSIRQSARSRKSRSTCIYTEKSSKRHRPSLSLMLGNS